MFDFQKLEVYHKAKEFCHIIKEFLHKGNFDRVTHDLLRHASFSIMLNIAEGCSRFSNQVYQDLEIRLDEISHMLFGLIKKLSN